MAAEPEEGRIKRGGFTFSVNRFHGRWIAGAEGSSGATRAAAIAAHLAHARRDARQYAKAGRAASKAADIRRASRAGRECGLTYCSSAIDTPAHRLTAKHRNAVAYDRARRTGRI